MSRFVVVLVVVVVGENPPPANNNNNNTCHRWPGHYYLVQQLSSLHPTDGDGYGYGTCMFGAVNGFFFFFRRWRRRRMEVAGPRGHSRRRCHADSWLVWGKCVCIGSYVFFSLLLGIGEGEDWVVDRWHDFTLVVISAHSVLSDQ
jgi:hypothetical protein